MLKKLSILLCVCISWILPAKESPVLLHYDFTSPVICRGGKCNQPVLSPDMKIASPDPALILNGKKGQSHLTVPGGEKLTLSRGGTLYALVKFHQNGRKSGQPDTHDMIFFKNQDFLLGRSADKLYFNMGSKWDWQVHAGPVPIKKWTALAATVRKDAPGIYTVKLFIDGKAVAEKVFERKSPKGSTAPLTLGKGWGGPWYFCGLLGKVMLFDRALPEEEIRRLSLEEPFLKKNILSVENRKMDTQK